MKINLKKYITLGVCFATALLVACDPDGEQKFDFEPGSELIISGAAAINTLAPANYYVNGFSIDHEYNWSLDGPDGDLEVLYSGSETEGEYVRVTANEPGTYTLTVTKNGNVTGTKTITATSADQQLGFETASSSVSENVGVIQVPVMIEDRNPAGASVSFTVTGENAVEGEDYEVQTTSPLVFGEAQDADGNSYMETSKNIEILWLNNLTVDEDEKTLTITLNEIVETGTGETEVTLTDSVELRTHVVTIEDEMKTAGFAAEQNVTITSVEEAGNYAFDVQLSEEATEDVEVMYTIPAEFSDRGGNILDEVSGTGSVTIFAGESTARIRVTIPEEAIVDGEEYTITLTGINSEDEEVSFAEGAEVVTINVDLGGDDGEGDDEGGE